MRKCHFIYDKEAGKVLIPHCWSVVISNDMSQCTCRDNVETFAQFERKEYNEKLNEQKLYIKELECEVSRLNRIIKKTSTNADEETINAYMKEAKKYYPKKNNTKF